MLQFDNLIYTINNMSCWFILLLFIMTLTAIVYLYREYVKIDTIQFNSKNKEKEGFTTLKDMEFDDNDIIYSNKTNRDKYNKFYVDMYDTLFYNKLTNDYEVGLILNKINSIRRNNILIVGSKTGGLVDLLSRKGNDVYGLENSTSMIKYSMEKYPEDNFILGDGTNSILFDAEKFTLIACLDFSIYNIKNHRLLFENLYKWLMPGGYLAIHLIEPNEYFKEKNIIKKVVNFAPFTKFFINNNKIINSIDIVEISLNDFNYKSNVIKITENKYIHNEIFINKKNGEIIENTDDLFIENPQIILSYAKDAGFNILSQTELTYVKKKNQYIYILYKPSL